jgi:hypothetical protein
MVLGMLANHHLRLYHTKMFNDQIMALYLVISVYYAITNCPLTASFFFTVGMGVKAGLILLIPGFLGSIQLNYGLPKLLVCIAVIVGVQVITALPFLMGDTNLSDYIIRSKLTGAGRQGIATTIREFDYLASLHDRTILFNWLPGHIYNTKELMADNLKLLQLGLNVYHFFLRKGCLMPCLQNVFKS